MNREALDKSIEVLRQTKDRWARMPLTDKIELLRKVVENTRKVADRQVQAAIQAKGIPPDSHLVGEEYLGGPVVQARICRLLADSLEDVMRHGRPQLPEGAVRTRAKDGQVIARVFPGDYLDRAMYAGFRAEVWMQPGVTEANLRDNMAGFYRQHAPEGAVALVLGAGNVASIGPLDMVQKLFAEGQVCMLKFNPVNDYLGPFVEEVFADLIAAGYVRTAYGGADVGDYLCQHPGVDEVHITGSDKTHDAIVFGVGAEGAKRKAENDPRLTKRITSELGNVSPIIVVPGPYSKAELVYQAENVATQLCNNGGFNCNAARMLVVHEGWAQRGAFMDALRSAFARAPQRKAYYPGAEERLERFVAAHPQAESIGARKPGVLPWTLIPNVDPKNVDDICFQVESWCGVMGQTALPGKDAGDFLRAAVQFCNDSVWGTLSAEIICHPKTQAELGEAFEDAIAEMRYGAVVVNHWPALAYALGVTTWGAYPGHTLQDIQSGIGVVHNTYMFDKPAKTVIYGPLRSRPMPPWFVFHRRMHKVARTLVEMEAAPSPFILPKIIWDAARP
jgi:hypothetical protein